MDHIKSSFYFKSRNDNWRVDYQDSTSKGWSSISCQVYLNDNIYWDFECDLPRTSISNPTKSQAKEMITAAKKAYKVKNQTRDDREKKLKTLGI